MSKAKQEPAQEQELYQVQDDPPTEQSTTVDTYVLPEHIRRDLLRGMAESIDTPQKLAKIGVMPAAAGLYRIQGADETTDDLKVPTFKGVVLHSHSRNVLWDREYGDNTPVADEERLPACSSPNSKVGIPRKGFAHAALDGAEATGDERIECASCPYNQWGSGDMLIATKNHKGKAVTNQKAIYIMLPGRKAPMVLTISGYSIAAWDEYMMGLMNQDIPVQSVVTEFAQKIQNRKGKDVALIVLRRAGVLPAETFQGALRKREEFRASIFPAEVLMEAKVDDGADAPSDDELEQFKGKIDEQDELPF